MAILMLALAFVLVELATPQLVRALGCPQGMSQLDCDAIFGTWTDWVPEDGGCETGGTTSLARNSASGGSYTPDQVKSFASTPITSTWGISDSTVEQWFLKQAGARATVAKYGLKSSNIGEITSAVKAAGVSPVFFYAYTVSEGGGAGGFINHYGSDIAGGGVANAKHDAEYLINQSKIMDSKPSWVDAGNPVDFVPNDVKNSGNADFRSLPSGSIGRAYIAATAATTWEVYYPNGLKKEYNKIQDYGAPLNATMQNIKAMGGDPMQGGVGIGCGSDDSADIAGCTPIGTQVHGEYSQEQLKEYFGDPGTSPTDNASMKANLVDVDFLGSTVKVHKKIAPCLKGVANKIKGMNVNYTIRTMGCYRFDSNNGSSNIGLKSYHTYGVACDINPDTNPFVASGAETSHDMPDQYVKAFADYGFTWGGKWNSPKDYMHFEFNGVKKP